MLRQEAAQSFLVTFRSYVHSRLLWSRCRKKERCTWFRKQDQEGGREEYFVYAWKKRENPTENSRFLIYILVTIKGLI